MLHNKITVSERRSNKKGLVLSVSQLESLKGLFNNSLVGTTKLLHFINPEKYAIWDSRVYYYLTGEEAYNHRIGNCEAYLSFLSFCDYLIQQNEFDELHNSICDRLGYQMTKLRTVELIMYLNGEKVKERRFTYASDLGSKVLTESEIIASIEKGVK